MQREDGVRMFRHVVDMLEEVDRLRTVEDRSESALSYRPAFHTDNLVQVGIFSEKSLRINLLKGTVSRKITGVKSSINR